MVPDQSNYITKVIPVVKAWGQKSFTGPDRRSQIDDAISYAWQIYLTAPADTLPTKIAYYAIKSVRANRQFSESSMCPMSPTGSRGRHQKPERQAIEAVFAARDNANPARLVAFKLDFQQWLADLNPRARQMAELLAMGHETHVVAEMLGVTPGAVSQWRRRLQDSWYATR